MDARSLGRAGEAAAAARYRHLGYRLLAANWRCRRGEIDLIVSRPGLVVFSEVKTRRSHGFGGPAAAVTPDKQRRIRRVASEWLSQNPISGRRDVRFDVAAVHPVGDTWSVEIHRSAF